MGSMSGVWVVLVTAATAHATHACVRSMLTHHSDHGTSHFQHFEQISEQKSNYREFQKVDNFKIINNSRLCRDKTTKIGAPGDRRYPFFVRVRDGCFSSHALSFSRYLAACSPSQRFWESNQLFQNRICARRRPGQVLS